MKKNISVCYLMVVVTVVIMLVSQTAAAQSESDPRVIAALEEAAAKETPRTADGHPDLNGMWNVPGLEPELNAFGGGGVGGQVSADGLTRTVLFLPPAEDPGSTILVSRAGDRSTAENRPEYKPEFERQRAEFAADPRRTDPTHYSCLPSGVPRMGWPNQIVQTPGQVVFLYQQSFQNPPSSTFRVIPTDGRPHRTNVDASFMGDSVGWWEGDTLVVDVTNFDDSTWLDGNGTLHSDALHVVERLTRKGDTLEYTVIVEDPTVLQRPWVRTVTRILADPDDSFLPDLFCIDMDQDHFVE